jgi:diguanylate cyclase (GGDEF)-like protein
MAFHLPLFFLLLQAGLLTLPKAASAPVAYLAMVVAPALAALAAFHRATRESDGARVGWSAAGLSLLLWSLGAFGNLWQEWVQGHVNEMYRSSMLLFNLATVPLVFLLASEWRPGARRYALLVDAAQASALGVGYFLYTWHMIAETAGPGEQGVDALVWLVDGQNLFLALGAAIRWAVAEDVPERDLFRALAIYTTAVLTLAFVNDHAFAGDPRFGPEWGTVITVAFALLAHTALRGAGHGPVHRAREGTERAVRTASPVVLAAALLFVALLLIRVDYPAGTVGVLVAVLGVAARNVMAQVGHIERSHDLQRQHTQLQAIAWTDALTGVANRHFLDQALRRAWRSELRARRAMGVLMIDIDHFKLLNDHYGHLAGDDCLRSVARTLQATLVRPDDLLARYGGEEFIALLRGVDLEGAMVVAERMRDAVRGLGLENAGSPFGVVTISVGVASAVLNNDAPPDRLVQLADRALYEAKCKGRDQVRNLVDQRG